ncbi:MAG: sulfatase-like hydrolase/transferase [Lentisphaerae bacterium]|jgi:choline-sulfatase|nr:sulfatase-like hydrolase/transferase [Lentisphaerota bacterium]MBT4821967.1 sulfatase-like hydrolase/transferase [Lentisphaerota bacterium]MBT5609872.1 sulfatase-like hydrolase/transferase [Lentisphaerota bacterium]MBT7060007.1 sulfatase-like hydrolase/transferase [Lentisphaerota bacterium]MBT7842496.1 sulfatase-like hydrolase/transferase [Lentisphaerota bacterium]
MTTARPNVLLLLTDSSQYQVFGGQPHPVCRTPNVDGLAAEGVRFDSAFSSAPVCHPARAAIQTGMLPHANGYMGNAIGPNAYPFELSEDVPCFAEILAQAGYRTGYAGQKHIRERGFADFAGLLSDYREWVQQQAPGLLSARPLGPPYCQEVDHDVDESREAWYARGTSELIERYANQDAPWLIECDFDAPHPPFPLPAGYASLYAPSDVALPASLDDDLLDKAEAHRVCRATQVGEGLSREDWQLFIASYWAYVTLTDHYIGQILATLDRTGQRENTVVIFTSDHGELVGAHGFITKYPQLWDEGLHVPLVMRWPEGAARGVVRQGFTSSIDLLPTICELAGATIPGTVHGESLVPLLAAGPEPEVGRDETFSEYDGNIGQAYSVRMVRTREWKYVFVPYGRDELYDLINDPGECVNLAGRSENRPALRDMQDRMARRMEQTRDHALGPLNARRKLTAR